MLIFRALPKRLVAFAAVCGLLFLISLPAAGQSGGTDGSLYSRFGVGELQRFPSSQLDAMGGGGIGAFSFNYMNMANPGTWSLQGLTRASFGVRFQNIEITDQAGNRSRLAGGALNNVHFGLPILADRFGIVLAFEPYSRMNYRVHMVDSLEVDPIDGEMVPYQIDYEGSGGLQEIRGGLGVRLSDNIRLGGSIDYVFGILEEGRRTTFAVGEGLRPTNRVDATRLSGVSGTAGLLLLQRDLLSEDDVLSLGASFTFPLQMSGTRVRTLGESLDRDTLGVAEQGSVEIPWKASAGISYATAARWNFVVDATYEPWTNFSSDISGFPRTVASGAFRDRVRVSAGAEVLPAGTNELAGLLARTAYRMGAYYDRAYFSPVEDVDLYTVAVTGGLSLPTMAAGTRVDLNFEVGTRGTTEQGLVRDLFYTLSATLNIGERWFVQRRLQ